MVTYKLSTRPPIIRELASSANVLGELPEEILQETLGYLNKSQLLAFAQSSRWTYTKAIPLIWTDIELVDCRTQHSHSHSHSGLDDEDDEEATSDDHDDTSILRILFILASNPWIASHVHTLEHRCHLPLPAIFYELPRINFQGRTLSQDVRTTWLLKKAVQNLSNLHTLRIIFGHWNITRGLLEELLSDSHPSQIRHLWLESCSISGLSAQTLQSFDLHGLESLRLRRLAILEKVGHVDAQEVYHRGASKCWTHNGMFPFRQDGRGGTYETQTYTFEQQESSVTKISSANDYETARDLHDSLFHEAYLYDQEVFNRLANEGLSLMVSFQPGRISNEPSSVLVRAMHDPEYLDVDPYPVFKTLLRSSASTLTSLNLDWIITRRVDSRSYLQDIANVYAPFKELFVLRFPCLRAFQLRNTVVAESELPPNLYLLDTCQTEYIPQADLCISFLEAHAKLKCLAWPADRFFGDNKQVSTDVKRRVDNIIECLATNLLDLRVDATYRRSGEFKTDASSSAEDFRRRTSRRRFISEFAARLKKLESLKMEGGLPRDEKRETVRALRLSPLKKIVLIGVNCPIGNTWGFCGKDLGSLGINEDPNDPNDFASLEDEDTEELMRLSATKPESQGTKETFEAQYGWPPSAPLIHTLAAHHSETVTELKFCGYRGAPLLWHPTDITMPMLAPLQNFHNLRHLIISLWLHTIYEGDHQDDNILAYWLNTRDSSSTAMVVVSSEELSGWQKELAELYEPSRMAARIMSMIGPFLSERAKSRPGGFHIRASFCIGTYGGLFDFDVCIGKAADGSDELRSWKGPREELHPERRAEKLQRRRWF